MPTQQPPADEITLPALLRGARGTYAAAIHARLTEAGFDDLPRNGVFVISAISRTGAPLAEIIRWLGVSKQAAGQLVDTLVLRGYLERAVDEEDRRRLRISLTARGREVAAITRAAVERIDARLLETVGADSLAHTRATLHALIALWRESSPRADPSSDAE